MQLKVYRRDNRKKDERRWHRYLFRLSAVVGSVILAVVVYRLSGPLGVAATSLYDFVLENPYFSVREIQVRGLNEVSDS